MSEAEPQKVDLRHLDPEVRKERIKLVANGVNAFGVALLIGAIAAPFLDAARPVAIWRSLAGAGIGLALVVAAVGLLRYMKARE